MRPLLMRCIALPLLAVLAGCAIAGPPRPLLWKVSDANNHIYLLGSFHALQAADYPVSPKVTAAFDDAESIAFEISPQEMQSPELPRKMMAAAALPTGSTLKSSIGEANWLRLQEYAQRRGLPLDAYQRVEPWFMSLVITLKEMAREGYQPELGLDQHLIALAARAGKPAVGLESADEQIAALDSMTPAEQEQSLSESLDGSGDANSRIDRVHARWRAGDEKALEEMMTTQFKRDYAQLYQRINVGRNQAWLPKIRRMLDAEDHDDVLVVVGSLHLLGSDGLVSQLRSQGYRVERL